MKKLNTEAQICLLIATIFFLSNPLINAGGLPIVKTLPPSSITRDSATLRGTVNPNGLKTDVRFKSCEGSSMTFTILGIDTISENLQYPVEVESRMQIFKPGKTYIYKIIAKNSAGISEGNCVSFTTVGDVLTPLPTTPSTSTAPTTSPPISISPITTLPPSATTTLPPTATSTQLPTQSSITPPNTATSNKNTGIPYSMTLIALILMFKIFNSVHITYNLK